jgi:hypothetical protein
VDVIFFRPLFTKNISGDLMKKDEMGGACGRYGGEERGIWDFDKEI